MIRAATVSSLWRKSLLFRVLWITWMTLNRKCASRDESIRTVSSQATYAALNAVEVAVFHFRGSIKRLCHRVSSLFLFFCSFFFLRKKKGWMVAGVWDSPTFRARASVGARQRVEFRQTEAEPPSQHLSIWLNTQRRRARGWRRRWGIDGSMLPGVSVCCQSPTKGASFRGGSWGFLGEEGGCAGDCDAWGVCHSGQGCGCHEERHRDSGRSRWPFHWVLAGHSQSALRSFEDKGRKQ